MTGANEHRILSSCVIWADYLNSLCLGFLTCKTGIRIDFLIGLLGVKEIIHGKSAGHADVKGV